MAEVRVSQAALEVLRAAQEGRVTEFSLDILHPTTNTLVAYVDQAVVEAVIYNRDVNAYVDQVVVEAAIGSPGYVYADQVVVEAVKAGIPQARVSYAAVEVSQDAEDGEARVSQAPVLAAAAGTVIQSTQEPLEVIASEGASLNPAMTQEVLEVLIEGGEALQPQVTQAPLEVLVRLTPPQPIECPGLGAIRVVNTLYRVEMERPYHNPGVGDPPWNSADTPPATGAWAHPLGGEVVDASGSYLTVRDTLTSGAYIDYNLLVLSGDNKYQSFPIAGNGTGTITLTSGTVETGTWVGIAKEVTPVQDGLSANRSINQRKALLSLNLLESESADRMNLFLWLRGVRFEQEDSITTQSMGWFFADTLQKELGSDHQISAYDPMYLGDIDVIEAAYVTDRIREWERESTGTEAVVVMKKVDNGTYYSFFNSIETGATAIDLNHTFNWAEDPIPRLWTSDDSLNQLSSGDDEVDIKNDPVEILYGYGEVRIDKLWLDDKGTGTQLKAQIARYVSYVDTYRGKAGTVLTGAGPTTTIVDSWRSNEYPVGSGTGLYGMSLRFVTGLARGYIFPINWNAATQVNIPYNGSIQVGDEFEIGYANYPHLIIEDVYRRAGFQLWQPDTPFYVNSMEPVLIPKRANDTYGLLVDQGALTDITNYARTETGTYTTSFTDNEYLYVGSDRPFRHISFYRLVGDGDAVYNIHTWDGSGWQTGTVVSDTTESLSEAGTIAFEPGNNWRPNIMTGSTMLWYARLHFTAMGGASADFSVRSIYTADRVQGDANYIFLKEEDTTYTEACERMLQDIIPPNTNYYADEDGELQLLPFIQSETASVALTNDHMASMGIATEDIYTAVYATGELRDERDYALSGAGATISGTFSGAPGTDPVSAYSDTNGLDVLIDGRYISWNPETESNSGVDETGVWGCDDNGRDDIYGAVLWTIDLGTTLTAIEAVELHYWIRKPSRAQGGNLQYSLDVSTNGTTWTKLSANTNPFSYPNQGKKWNVDRFTSEESEWQSSWRYIRFTLDLPYTHNGRWWSPFFSEVKVTKGFKTEAEVVAGDTDPFQAEYYKQLHKRLWKRTKVVGPIPLTTEQALLDYARDYLKYTLATGDPIRGQVWARVSLGDTVQLPVTYINQIGWGLDGNYMVTETTHNMDGSVGITARDFRVNES